MASPVEERPKTTVKIDGNDLEVDAVPDHMCWEEKLRYDLMTGRIGADSIKELLGHKIYEANATLNAADMLAYIGNATPKEIRGFFRKWYIAAETRMQNLIRPWRLPPGTQYSAPQQAQIDAVSVTIPHNYDADSPIWLPEETIQALWEMTCAASAIIAAFGPKKALKGAEKSTRMWKILGKVSSRFISVVAGFIAMVEDRPVMARGVANAPAEVMIMLTGNITRGGLMFPIKNRKAVELTIANDLVINCAAHDQTASRQLLVVGSVINEMQKSNLESIPMASPSPALVALLESPLQRVHGLAASGDRAMRLIRHMTINDAADLRGRLQTWVLGLENFQTHVQAHRAGTTPMTDAIHATNIPHIWCSQAANQVAANQDET
jgi:hypothetical protein